MPPPSMIVVLSLSIVTFLPCQGLEKRLTPYSTGRAGTRCVAVVSRVTNRGGAPR